MHWPNIGGICAAVVLVLSAACGPAPLSLPSIGRGTPAAAQPVPPSAAAGAATAVQMEGTAAAPTQGEFVLNLTPLPTATALPTLALPTESRFAASFEVWDGQPSYPAESRPDFYFRVRYDPATWARTTDQFGAPSLAHRNIPDCLIAPTGGRGLPLNGTVDHAIRHIGGIDYQVNTAYVNGVKQFVTYVGGDDAIYTAFQVNFPDPADQCLSDAEGVLGTLGAVPVTEATPIATP